MKRLKILFSIAFGFFFTTAFAATTQQSPVGFWKTMDDMSGKPKSIIKIWETPEHLLVGQITKVFASNGKKPSELCDACVGDKHNQPIIGMVILSGLKAVKQRWGSGKIIDPLNGKTYNCSLKVAENGKKLNIRGYVGLPLFGRSQTWERVDIMSAT